MNTSFTGQICCCITKPVHFILIVGSPGEGTGLVLRYQTSTFPVPSHSQVSELGNYNLETMYNLHGDTIKVWGNASVTHTHQQGGVTEANLPTSPPVQLEIEWNAVCRQRSGTHFYLPGVLQSDCSILHRATWLITLCSGPTPNPWVVSWVCVSRLGCPSP